MVGDMMLNIRRYFNRLMSQSKQQQLSSSVAILLLNNSPPNDRKLSSELPRTTACSIDSDADDVPVFCESPVHLNPRVDQDITPFDDDDWQTVWMKLYRLRERKLLFSLKQISGIFMLDSYAVQQWMNVLVELLGLETAEAKCGIDLLLSIPSINQLAQDDDQYHAQRSMHFFMIEKLRTYHRRPALLNEDTEAALALLFTKKLVARSADVSNQELVFLLRQENVLRHMSDQYHLLLQIGLAHNSWVSLYILAHYSAEICDAVNKREIPQHEDNIDLVTMEKASATACLNQPQTLSL